MYHITGVTSYSSDVIRVKKSKKDEMGKACRTYKRNENCTV
jgi:hypothetical protein